ncbi:MAG: hypothetical protein HYY67_02410 [Thaumarchaeota archaeon]|nr:hypothetical protein [Nitrososphaerota archaeon]
MGKTTCYVCKAGKAQVCKNCQQLVCKSHRDLYFNESARSFTMLCQNCGKKIAPFIPRARYR